MRTGPFAQEKVIAMLNNYYVSYYVAEEDFENFGLMPADEKADTGGIGGTVAANVLSLAATRSTLAEVLTDEAFECMIAVTQVFRKVSPS